MEGGKGYQWVHWGQSHSERVYFLEVGVRVGTSSRDKKNSGARGRLTKTGLAGLDLGCWRAKSTASWTEAKRCCLVIDASKKCPASSWETTGAAGKE